MPDDLARRVAPLEMSPEAFRAAGHELVDEIAEFLAGLAAGPVCHDVSPSGVRAALPADDLPLTGRDPLELLAEARRLLADGSLFNGHPRFMGYITSSAAPAGALADLLAAAVNPNLGGWQLSPVASEIEGQCVRWIADLLGFPRDAGGLLVSGGNMANFVGFVAARRWAGGEELRRNGPGEHRLTCYVSAETHTWVEKAADLFGLGTEAVRWVPVDESGQLDLSALERVIEEDRRAGRRPFLVVGNAGTVGTGSVDPLVDLAELAGREKLWFHVDGAYGAFAAVAPEAPPELAAGLALADSVAVDPHKWLYAPLEAGCALVRDKERLRDAFSYVPSYYRFDGEDEPRDNYFELGPQNSRGFRALKVWVGIRQAGLDGIRRMISDDIRLAQALHQAAERHPEIEARTCRLSIATFRYLPPGFDPADAADRERLDSLNEEILERMKREGELFVSNAVVDGDFLLRACIVNFRTTVDDVRSVPEIVARVGRSLHRRA